MGFTLPRLSATRAASPPAPGTNLLIAIGIAVAVGTGTLLVAAPLLTFGAVVAGVVMVLLAALGRRSAQVFVVSLGALLIAYALCGRGVAYVGTGSLYVGEALLFLGIAALALNLGQARFGLLHWLIIGFMVFGLVRTVPYVGAYGQTALRDGVVWGYAAFALAVATMFDPRWFEPLTRAYRVFAPIFLAWLPVATAITIQLGDRLPRWPGAPVPLVVVKQGDFAVQVAGIAAFVLLGLHARRGGGVPSWLMWVLLFIDMAIIGAVSRGGLLAAGLGAASALLFVRSGQRLFTAAGIALAGFVLLYAINPSVNVGSTQGRELSFSQLVENVGSVLQSDQGQGNLEGTKEWRLAWWNKIVGYTVDGPYFWTGKGFGINLADADGFQVLADHSLREPHNGHLALLARGGVPLLTLWILIQAAFGIGLVRAAQRARAAGSLLYVQLAGWIFAIWLAALVNMSFDVYLEGPQGGIWFWSVIGVGLAVMSAASRLGSTDETALPAAPRPVTKPAGPVAPGMSGG